MKPEIMPDGCTKCSLHETRTNIVIYRGSPGAPILFVGEAPGATEDEKGQPFLGRSGKLLDQWISFLGLEDEEFCITNVVRCRPPKNRLPTKEERNTCGAHLVGFIRDTSPKLIIALGRTSDKFLDAAEIPHIFMKHPSYYLRGNPYFDDLVELQNTIEKLWDGYSRSDKNDNESLH